MFYKIVLLLFSLTLASCKCQKQTSNFKVAQEEVLKYEEIFYRRWVAGIQEAGSGINFYVVLKEPLTSEVILEKVQFESYVGLFIKQSDSVYIANIKTNLNDLVLDEDPKNEYGNKPPVAKLKSKEANLYYQVNGKEVIHNFKNVKEKEMLAYPSMKPQNNEE